MLGKNIPHLDYDETKYDPTDYHNAIIKLLSEIEVKLGKRKNKLQMIDIGSGHGKLLERLKKENYENIIGVDFDQKCVEMSSRYAKSYKADIDNIDTIGLNNIDVAILAHVLEHLENPRLALEKIRKIARYIILAVPNPSRTKVILRHNLFSKDYSNKGHYYCWDRSHLKNFITTYCNLSIERWITDRVYIFPFRTVRVILRNLGILDKIEVDLLPNYFSYFSSTLIVLCKSS